jgi:signal transduction histidine kinase/ActR/RegA family two-component response regulator
MTTLHSIVHLSAPVSPGSKGAEVFERFLAEPDLMTIAVVDADAIPVGLIDRSNFTLRMGSVYGRALYAGRPISMIMDEDPLIVDEAALVADFAGDAIARRPSALLQGFIVVSQGRYLGVGSAISLLQAVTEDSQRRARELSDIARVLSDAKADVQVALEQAETANLAKSEFLANMSHEIRTPLNGVVGIASVLAASGLTPKQSELVDIIETSAKTLQTLLADVLDVSKIEAGRLELQREIVSPSALARHIGKLFSAPSAEKGLRFELHIEEGADQPVWGDGTRLVQIITNLCSNAVKFTEAGHVTLSVGAEAHGMQRRVSFSVSDSGIGLSETAQARLFERFSQADGSITRRFGGTGLGLSISQELAHLMGSDIQVTSCEGQGSTFTVAFDLDPAIAEAQAPAEPRQSVHDAEPQPLEARLRVLLVEDHPVNRKVVELMIGDLVDLHMAENGQEGLEAAKAQPYDLILMDMQMPVLDGLTATRAIRAHEQASGAPRTPIIILTANALPEHVHASRAAGADTHLAKPISTDLLLSTMDAVLSADAQGEGAPGLEDAA